MKRGLAIILMMLAGGYAFGQQKTFSLEIGTGLPPMHSLLGSRDVEYKVAPDGQEVESSTNLSANISGVLSLSDDWEVALTLDAAWYHCRIIQYPTFGVDPNGNPRYEVNYDKATDAGTLDGGFTWSLTCMARHIWNPEKSFQAYSEIGIGLVTDFDGAVAPMPGITPIGVRYRWKHFYIFAENTFSPSATLVRSGLGWKF